MGLRLSSRRPLSSLPRSLFFYAAAVLAQQGQLHHVWARGAGSGGHKFRRDLSQEVPTLKTHGNHFNRNMYYSHWILSPCV